MPQLKSGAAKALHGRRLGLVVQVGSAVVETTGVIQEVEVSASVILRVTIAPTEGWAAPQGPVDLEVDDLLVRIAPKGRRIDALINRAVAGSTIRVREVQGGPCGRCGVEGNGSFCGHCGLQVRLRPRPRRCSAALHSRLPTPYCQACGFYGEGRISGKAARL
jgi:hypothetical protein